MDHRARMAAMIATLAFEHRHSGEFQNDTAAAAFAGRISRARPQFGRSRRAPFLSSSSRLQARDDHGA